MQRELQISLPAYAARTTWRLLGHLQCLVLLSPMFKNQSSTILRGLYPQHLLVVSMARLAKESSDSARTRVTKGRHQWMRIAMCQWKHHQMKIRLVRLLEAYCLPVWRREGNQRGAEMKETKKKEKISVI